MPTPVEPTNPNDPASVAAAEAASQRVVYREGVIVTDPKEIALANEILDADHANYACRDMWEDYKECVNQVWEKKQEDYLRRRAEKAEAATQPAQAQKK